MREFKFRAWDKEERKMIYLDKVIDPQHHKLIIGENGCIEYLNYQNGVGAEETVLLQYTGLKDDNGTEIYEGDILLCGEVALLEIEYSNELSVVGFVGRYIGPDCYCECMNSILENMECKIVGNIFENPELLKQEEK